LRQSCHYIRHRTQSAGQPAALFTKPALWYIAIVSRGIPRTINICCDNALINGYGHSAKIISLGIAREACSSLEYRAPIGRAAAAAAVLVVALIGLIYGSAWLGRPAGAPIAASDPARSGRSPPTNSTPAADPSTQPARAAPTPVAAPPPATTAPAAGTAPAPSAVTTAPATAAPAVTAPATAVSVPAAPEPLPESHRPTHADPTVHAAAKTSARPLAGALGAPTPLKWVVRNGDSVYSACLKTYGSCDRKTLRAVLADNPQIGSGLVLHRGEVLMMPESIGWLRAKPH
jgi:hypothetical protein